MKKGIYFAGLTAVSLLLSFCTKDSTEVRMLDIQPHELAISIDSTSFENKEVKVFKGLWDKYNYTVVMCHEYSGEKKKYRASILDKVSYDQASVVWINDTTIDVKLIDSKSSKEYPFTMFANNSSVSITIPD